MSHPPSSPRGRERIGGRARATIIKVAQRCITSDTQTLVEVIA